MIEKIDVSGSGYKVEDSFKKYVLKRIGKLDRYLPRGSKKDVVVKVMVSSIDRAHGEKYEISVSLVSFDVKDCLCARPFCSRRRRSFG